MRIATVSRLFGAGILAYALAACSGSGGSGSNGGITPPGVPNGASRVYVSCPFCSPNGQILQYLTPISNGNFELALNLPPPFTAPEGATVDPSGSRLVVGCAGGVVVYNLPLTASSTPFFTIPIAGSIVVQTAFDRSGNLFVPTGGNGNVDVFTPPISGSSTPAVVHTGYGDPTQVAFDASGNIYVADLSANKVYVYAPPFTSGSTPIATLTTANGFSTLNSASIDPFNRLAIADRGAGKAIRFYSLPLTSTSLPIFSVVAGVTSPKFAGFDYVGNLFVDNDAPNNLVEYLAPLSGASTPNSGSPATAGFASHGEGLGFGP